MTMMQKKKKKSCAGFPLLKQATEVTFLIFQNDLLPPKKQNKTMFAIRDCFPLPLWAFKTQRETLNLAKQHQLYVNG